MACPHCGSWAVTADRALAGRMVCGRCGKPLGGTVVPLRRRRAHQPRLPRLVVVLARLGRSRLWLAGLALLCLGAVLASLEPRPVQRRPSNSSQVGAPEAALPLGRGQRQRSAVLAAVLAAASSPGCG
ncbi:MAG: hypothetical protein ACKOPN_08020 [Prochlorococcaceae cyanobacterium]